MALRERPQGAEALDELSASDVGLLEKTWAQFGHLSDGSCATNASTLPGMARPTRVSQPDHAREHLRGARLLTSRVATSCKWSPRGSTSRSALRGAVVVFFVARRATLLIPSGPADDVDRKHLFVAMTDPSGERARFCWPQCPLLSQGGTWRCACLLVPGDHPFIQHDSFINYRFLRIESEAALLLRGVADRNMLLPKGPLSAEVFARVVPC